MHLREIDSDDEFFINLFDHIKKYVPEFQTQFDKEDHYMIMFEFGEFFKNNVNNEDLFNRYISFINEALNKGTSITEELVAGEFFSQLYNDESLCLKVKEKLSESAKIIFDYYRLHHNRNYPRSR